MEPQEEKQSGSKACSPESSDPIDWTIQASDQQGLVLSTFQSKGYCRSWPQESFDSMALDSSFVFVDWIFLIKLLILFLSLTFFMGEKNIDAVKDKAVWKLCEFMYMNHITEIDSP